LIIKIKKEVLENLILFFIKVLIVVILLSLLIESFRSIEIKWPKNYKANIFMLSLVKNPNLLYILSENDEREKKIDMAILDIQAAIGILEFQNITTGPIAEKYNARLKKLKDNNLAINKPIKNKN
jgi:hypothetical protein